jgi:single-strand DNA-binding protein
VVPHEGPNPLGPGRKGQTMKPGPLTSPEAAAHPPMAGSRNAVALWGRVSVDPLETTLPSGDVVVSIRLVVSRGEKARKPPYVDTIDCSAWTARSRRTVLTWREGDVVAVEGALRRRFWRGSTGAQSRYEVEISAARRLEQRKD